MDRRSFFPALAALAAAPVLAEKAPPAAATSDGPPLDVRITYATHVVTRAGVARSERWQERLVRRPGHVWIERLMPPEIASSSESEPQGEHDPHKHFDFERAARHVSRETDGSVRIEYVDTEHRVAVFVPASEYEAVGFHGNWALAAFLVPPDAVDRMPVEAAAPRAGDAQWHSERRSGWTTRVLWSPQQRFPIAIDIRRDDGTTIRETRVERLPPTPDMQLPWTRLAGYLRKDYDDFMD